MKKLLLLAIMLTTLVFALSGAYTESTVLRDFAIYTDTGSDVDPNNSCGTGVDGYTSATFSGKNLTNTVFVAVATVQDTISGTNAHHLTPLIQVSGDGTTWVTAYTLEAYSSTAITIGHAWTMVIDLTRYTAPYFRIAYAVHTSAHAAITDVANLGGEYPLKTVIYLKP